jgi:hypothetical protein
MNLFKRFYNWMFLEKTSYYYRLNTETDEPEKVSADVAIPENHTEEELHAACGSGCECDCPLFTIEELKEMKKKDLFELAQDGGLKCKKTDKKKDLIKKITLHYELT